MAEEETAAPSNSEMMVSLSGMSEREVAKSSKLVIAVVIWRISCALAFLRFPVSVRGLMGHGTAVALSGSEYGREL